MGENIMTHSIGYIATANNKTHKPEPNIFVPKFNSLQDVQISIRNTSKNPNHHLWNNNGTWYIHYTIFPDDLTAKRIRHSLRTKNLMVARLRRDNVLQQSKTSHA